jgi:hypothetical protein
MHLKKWTVIFVLMGCLHSLLMGCVHSAESLRQMPPEQLLEHIEREESKIHSVKGQARLKIDSPEQKGVIEILVAVRLPDDIHLELLDGLGRPVRIFVSHAGQFALWDMEKNTFYRGPATRDNLARFLPLYFSPKELAKVLLGAAPRLSGARLAEVQAQRPGNSKEKVSGQQTSLFLTAENVSQWLTIHPKHFRVIESEIQGAQSYELVFASFVRIGSQKVFPEQRILKVSSSPLFLELSYTDYSVDLPLEDKLFILIPPEGIRVVDVEEALSLNGSPNGGRPGVRSHSR